MNNHSLWFLLQVLLACGVQLLLAWLMWTRGRRAGMQPWKILVLVLASGMLLAELARRTLPEQLPVCTDDLMHYLQCLGFPA